MKNTDFWLPLKSENQKYWTYIIIWTTTAGAEKWPTPLNVMYSLRDTLHRTDYSLFFHQCLCWILTLIHHIACFVFSHPTLFIHLYIYFLLKYHWHIISFTYITYLPHLGMWICNSAPKINNPEFKSVTDWLYNIDLPTYISHLENGDDIIMFILKFVSIKWDNEFKRRCLVLSKYLVSAIYHHSY